MLGVTALITAIIGLITVVPTLGATAAVTTTALTITSTEIVTQAFLAGLVSSVTLFIQQVEISLEIRLDGARMSEQEHIEKQNKFDLNLMITSCGAYFASIALIINNIVTELTDKYWNNPNAPTVDYKGEKRPVYRGGNDFTVSSKDVRFTDSGNVKTNHGVSVDVDPQNVFKHGAAYRVEYIPDGLKIIQRGNRAEHFEIVPSYEMSLESFQK